MENSWLKNLLVAGGTLAGVVGGVELCNAIDPVCGTFRQLIFGIIGGVVGNVGTKKVLE